MIDGKFDESLLSAYLDGELDAIDSVRVEESLRASAELRRTLDELRWVRALVVDSLSNRKEVSQVDPMLSVSGPWQSNSYDRTSVQVAAPKLKGWNSRRRVLQLTAALAASICVIVAMSAQYWSGSSGQKLSEASKREEKNEVRKEPEQKPEPEMAMNEAEYKNIERPMSRADYVESNRDLSIKLGIDRQAGADQWGIDPKGITLEESLAVSAGDKTNNDEKIFGANRAKTRLWAENEAGDRIEVARPEVFFSFIEQPLSYRNGSVSDQPVSAVDALELNSKIDSKKEQLDRRASKKVEEENSNERVTNQPIKGYYDVLDEPETNRDADKLSFRFVLPTEATDKRLLTDSNQSDPITIASIAQASNLWGRDANIVFEVARLPFGERQLSSELTPSVEFFSEVETLNDMPENKNRGIQEQSLNRRKTKIADGSGIADSEPPMPTGVEKVSDAVKAAGLSNGHFGSSFDSRRSPQLSLAANQPTPAANQIVEFRFHRSQAEAATKLLAKFGIVLPSQSDELNRIDDSKDSQDNGTNLNGQLESDFEKQKLNENSDWIRWRIELSIPELQSGQQSKATPEKP